MIIQVFWDVTACRPVSSYPSFKTVPRPPSKKGRPAKNPYTKSGRWTASRGVIWVWRERVNLYNRQKMILRRKPTIYNTVGPLLPYWTAGPRQFLPASPPSLPPFGTAGNLVYVEVRIKFRTAQNIFVNVGS